MLGAPLMGNNHLAYRPYYRAYSPSEKTPPCMLQADLISCRVKDRASDPNAVDLSPDRT